MPALVLNMGTGQGGQNEDSYFWFLTNQRTRHVCRLVSDRVVSTMLLLFVLGKSSSRLFVRIRVSEVSSAQQTSMTCKLCSPAFTGNSQAVAPQEDTSL